ncbi:MAG TPA: hypothetical protein V6C81_05030 [Planktothrix sp.]|jgi:hypothetical protein
MLWTKQGWTKIGGTYFAVFCMLATMCVVSGNLYGLCHARDSESEFDTTKWKALSKSPKEDGSHRDRSKPQRLDCINDLLARYKLVGMTRSQIRELLGEPNWNEGATDAYWLGWTPSMMLPEPEKLYLKFRDDVVVSSRISHY